MFKYFVSAMSSRAWSRNFVTVTSLDLAKNLVTLMSSATCSNCFWIGLAESKNLVTVISFAAWSKNLVTVVSRNFVTETSLAAAN